MVGFGIITAMLANAVWWKPESGEFLVFMGVLVTAFFSFMSSRRSKNVQTTVKDAKEAAEKAVDQQDTGNGKDIGKTVHDMAQTVEILSAQVHTNTREVVAVVQNQSRLAENQQRIEEKLDTHMMEANRVHGKLLESLVEDEDQS